MKDKESFQDYDERKEIWRQNSIFLYLCMHFFSDVLSVHLRLPRIIYWTRWGQSMNSNHMHKTCPQGFSGCSAVKSPPAIAGDMGLIPGLGRSHILQSNQAREPQLLSLCPRDQEPQLMGPHASTTEVHVPWSLCPAIREATAVRSQRIAAGEQPPLSATREVSMQQRRPSTAKSK